MLRYISYSYILSRWKEVDEQMELRIIGEGNTAEVYSWKDGQILKLFRAEFPLGGIEKEYKVSKDVEKLGISIPKAEEMIEYNGRTGIVYERITGESVLNLISTKPWLAKKCMRHLAKMHYEMHQCQAKELGSYKEALEWNIVHSNVFTEQVKNALLNTLTKLPEGNALCHGDFHPGNVIRTKEKYVVLDWMTAARGCPAVDVARTALLLGEAALPDNLSVIVKIMVTWLRGRMLNYYLKCYKRYSGLTQEEIDVWRLPILAARLAEWIPDSERKALLSEIEGLLS